MGVAVHQLAAGQQSAGLGQAIRDGIIGLEDMLAREQLPDWLGDDAALRREAGE